MNVFRNGKVHIANRMCDTCIFRPGNLMHLDDGRRDAMVSQAIDNDTAIICHSTLDGLNAVCRGFFEHHATNTLKLAVAMQCVEYDSVDGLHP